MAVINPAPFFMASSGDASFDTTLIPKSVWMDGSADGFTRAASDFDAEDGKEFTLGTWFQLTELGVTGALFCAGNGSGTYTSLRHSNDDKIYFQTEAGSAILSTAAVFRDLGWYHILLSVDTTQVPSHNRVRLFINGEESVFSGTQPSENHAYDFNVASVHEVGDSYENGAFEGYLAQSFMIGSKSIQQGDFSITDFLDTFTFGTNGSQFIPKADSEIKTLVDAGSDNSFLLDYDPADPTASNALGLDISTYGNNFTSTSMAAANQSTNTPSKMYSFFNPLANGDGTVSEIGSFSVSNGNQTATLSSSNQWLKTTLPFVMSGSNIIRTQFTIDTVGNGAVGITGSPHVGGTYHTSALGIPGQGEVLLLADGSCVVDGNFGSSGYTSSWSNGDVVDVIVNLNVGAVYFALNGTLGGSATQAEIQAGTTTNAADGGTFVRRTAGEVFNFFVAQTNPSSTTITYNSGHSSFSNSYSTITSLISLNTADLSAPDFQGIDYFDSTLYTGNGSGQRVGDFVPFTDAYAVDNSAMFEHDDAKYLSRTIETPSSSGGKKGTWSVWYKAANVDTDCVFFDTGTTATNRFSLQMDASGQIVFSHGGTTVLKTSGDFKGAGAWHNVVLKVDTALDPGETGTGATPNRAIMFIDGVQLASTDFDTTPTNTNIPKDEEIGYMDPGATQFVGSFNGSSANQWDGYLAEVVFLDNQYLNASSFGQLDTSTNRWIPKDVSGLTFGNCGSYLEFEGDFSSTSLGNDAGEDSSGNGNHFAQGGTWAASDKFIDTPSSSFPLIFKPDGQTDGTLSEGNTKLTGASDSMVAVGWSENDPAIPSGKWFMEFATGTVTGGNISWGMSNVQSIEDFGYVGQQSNQAGFTFQSASQVDMFQNGTLVGDNVGLGFTFTTSDVGVIAYDADNKKMWMGFWDAGSASQITWVNGDFSATTTFPSTNPTFNIADQDNPIFAIYANASPRYILVNTGSQMVFNGASTTLSTAAGGRFLSAAAIPTDFKALNVDNLSDTESKVTAWAWIKNREVDHDNHVLVDRVRGVGEVLASNSNAADVTNANSVQRFLQRGVQIGSEVSVNTNNEDYALWQWLLGDSATTGSTLSGGSPDITSTGIVADAGHFSIGVYEGSGQDDDDISHGLGGTIEMLMVKHFAADTDDWMVWHKSLASNSHQLHLNTNDDQDTTKNAWGSNPVFDANVFRVGVTDETNKNSTGNSHVFYAFRSIPGVCKIGNYEGNNASSGAGFYLSLGFRPRWFMVKNIDTSGQDWRIYDTAVEPINPNDQFFKANDAAAQISSSGFDFLSDGVKARDNNAGFNSAATFIYMAMADIAGNGTLPPIYGR